MGQAALKKGFLPRKGIADESQEMQSREIRIAFTLCKIA